MRFIIILQLLTESALLMFQIRVLLINQRSLVLFFHLIHKMKIDIGIRLFCMQQRNEQTECYNAYNRDKKSLINAVN